MIFSMDPNFRLVPDGEPFPQVRGCVLEANPLLFSGDVVVRCLTHRAEIGVLPRNLTLSLDTKRGVQAAVRGIVERHEVSLSAFVDEGAGI